jgi:twitching motility protein PilT
VLTHFLGLGASGAIYLCRERDLGRVFRIIPERIKTAAELNLPQTILDLIDADRGLVLVTGPTGSGKSTTLASMIHEINLTREAHIITVEDPIEFVHQNVKSLVNQREVGSHTKSFANALKAALREDPDILLVGELRDLETISLALTAAETGHLVFGTLHTNSASKTIDRIIDVFPAGQQQQIRTMLAESLRGVVAQALFSRADGQGRVAAFEILKEHQSSCKPNS